MVSIGDIKKCPSGGALDTHIAFRVHALLQRHYDHACIFPMVSRTTTFCLLTSASLHVLLEVDLTSTSRRTRRQKDV
jgi:hypothetical protein